MPQRVALVDPSLHSVEMCCEVIRQVAVTDGRGRTDGGKELAPLSSQSSAFPYTGVPLFATPGSASLSVPGLLG